VVQLFDQRVVENKNYIGSLVCPYFIYTLSKAGESERNYFGTGTTYLDMEYLNASIPSFLNCAGPLY